MQISHSINKTVSPSRDQTIEDTTKIFSMKWNESKFLHVCSPILEHDDGDVIIEEIQYAHMYKIWYLKHSFGNPICTHLGWPTRNRANSFNRDFPNECSASSNISTKAVIQTRNILWSHQKHLHHLSSFRNVCNVKNSTLKKSGGVKIAEKN